jgi:glycerol uptake facilitator-like aquaporin
MAWAYEDTVAPAAYRTTAGGMERRATSAYAADRRDDRRRVGGARQPGGHGRALRDPQDRAAAGFLAELLGTFALVWAYMGAAVNPRSDKAWAPLVIGAAYGLSVMVLGPMTGAALNPARAFGPALVSGEFGGAGTFLLAYVLGPVAGALAAAFAYGAIVLRGGPSLRPVDKLGSPES